MENIGFLDFLETMSPWWWLAFAVVLGVLEMTTLSFFLIWPGIAALVMWILVSIFPGMSGEVQIVLFAAMSVGFTWAGRVYMARTGQAPSDRPGLNRRTERMIGRRGSALEPFRAGEGPVEIDGVRWPARAAAALSKGASVVVTGIDGSTLLVEPTQVE